MTDYSKAANQTAINVAVQALGANGFKVTVVNDLAAAKAAVLALLPKGAEVLTVTSQTVEATGLAAAINESGDYDAVRPKLVALMADASKKREQRKLGSAPDFVVGSVHALTQDGHALVASATGSQLPAYTYGAERVIWVVGAQKIVKDLREARDRLETYTFPLEDARALKAYGGHSSINKVLTYEKDPASRVEIIITKEAVGF